MTAKYLGATQAMVICIVVTMMEASITISLQGN